MARNIVQLSRRQPGPGQYNHSHYSDFFQSEISTIPGTQQNFFGKSKKCDIPEF